MTITGVYGKSDVGLIGWSSSPPIKQGPIALLYTGKYIEHVYRGKELQPVYREKQ